MTPEEIRLELFQRRKKVTMASIARKLNVCGQAVYLVVEQKSVSGRIMQAVADAIEKPVEVVFSDYYQKKAC